MLPASHVLANGRMSISIVEGQGTSFMNYCNSNPSDNVEFWPAFGVTLNGKSLKKHGCSKIYCKVMNSALNTVKDAEFKSSFDEYLKAMESVREDREKKKKFKDVTVDKGASLDQKDIRNVEFKGSEFDGRDGFSEGFKRVFHEKRMDYSVSGSGKVGNGRWKSDLSKEFGSSREKNFKISDPSRRRGKDARVRVVDKELQMEKFGSSMEKNSKISDPSGRRGKDASDAAVDKQLEMEKFIFESRDVQESPRASWAEMEDRIQKLARCLHGADVDIPEWMFSKMMRSAKIKFSDQTILRVIQILGKLGNWRRVLQIIEWLQMHERFKSHKMRYVYTSALDALRKARRPVEALNVFRLMQKHKSLYPDLVAYRCIAVTLGQAGYMKELFDVMDSMRSTPKNFKIGAFENSDPRLEPDIVVYNAVLNACIKRKQWEGAFWVLQQLKQTSQQPSSSTYGLVMEVMLACGKYNLVHEFFRKVQRSSIPNALTYRVIVNAFWREGKTDEALAAVEDMERRGTVGSASVYYDLARCLCSAGRCEEALVQVDKICKVASKPLTVTYTGLIQACLNAGNIQNGTYIFNHMHKYCSPNLVTCNIVLKAYLEHGMFGEANALFQKMSQNGETGSEDKCKDRVTPDNYTFNTMLDACIEHKRWDDFVFAYEQMLKHGYGFNTKRHLWMILRASAAGKTDVVETTWKHLTQSNRIPPPQLIKERFRFKLEHNDIAAALSTILRHPPSKQQAFSKESWLTFFKENAGIFDTQILQQLICEISNFLSRNEQENLILNIVLESCTEIVRTHKPRFVNNLI